MSSSSRQSRRDAARRREQAASRPRWLLPALAVLAVVVVGGAAVLLSGQPADGGAQSSARPSASGGPVTGDAPTITGLSLVPFDPTVADAAVGQAAPTVVGSSFDGQPVSVGGNGRPQMLLFLAHWCSHCQAEVPLVQAWIDQGGLPDGVDVVSVSTATDPAAPNYPPEEWLAREGWTPPVMVDPTGSVATAFGLSAFPYFVFVDVDGTVTGRMTGEVPIGELDAIADQLAAGS